MIHWSSYYTFHSDKIYISILLYKKYLEVSGPNITYQKQILWYRPCIVESSDQVRKGKRAASVCVCVCVWKQDLQSVYVTLKNKFLISVRLLRQDFVAKMFYAAPSTPPPPRQCFLLSLLFIHPVLALSSSHPPSLSPVALPPPPLLPPSSILSLSSLLPRCSKWWQC